MSAALDVLADVVISTPAGDTRVTGRGESLEIELPSLAAARLLLASPWTSRRAQRRRSAGTLSRGLDRIGMTMLVKVRGRQIAATGRGVRPGSVAALTGLHGFRFRLRALLSAALDR